MDVRLHRSMLVAGDTLRFDCSLENGCKSSRLALYLDTHTTTTATTTTIVATKPCEYIQVTLKQQLELLHKPKKKVTVCQRVYKTRFADVKQTVIPGTYTAVLEFKLPDRLPQTQTTPRGVVTVEYHVNVRAHLPWAIDMRVRLPLLILEQTRFPQLQSVINAVIIFNFFEEKKCTEN